MTVCDCPTAPNHHPSCLLFGPRPATSSEAARRAALDACRTAVAAVKESRKKPAEENQ